MAKHARERARQERQAAKRERRIAAPDPDPADRPDEAELMEEFRLLSERHAAGTIDTAHYEGERHRIFVELGIESDDD